MYRVHPSRFCTLATALFLMAASSFILADTGQLPSEYPGRRLALMKEAGEGFVILFGNVQPLEGLRFRQDNDFFYFTGIEDKEAVLVMASRTKETYLFLPQQTEREIMVEGPNLLKDAEAFNKTGLSRIFPLTYFDEFLVRGSGGQGKIFHLRLAGADQSDRDRGESRMGQARSSRLHYQAQPTLEQFRIARLRERYPEFEFRDITPAIDRMRLIKSPGEIELLRRNGKISAEGVRRAIIASGPGRFEYELEGAAVGWVLSQGARQLAFAPIVASGPNACTWHYDRNDRRMEPGDLVVMDFGSELQHLDMDITRTWPVSGTFTPPQREVYRAALEVQKACIDCYRPGVTSAEVERRVREVLAGKGIDPLGLKGGVHHFVGLSTHDGYLGDRPLQEGMVLAIEPGLYFPERNIGVRIEDTVLITASGCEVLTAAAPKEIDEVEALLKKNRLREGRKRN